MLFDPLWENRLPPENTYPPGVADRLTLTLTMPSASCLEDHSACRGWRDSSNEKQLTQANWRGNIPGQQKKGAIIAPWDVVTGLDPNDRLRPLAYPYTAAVTPYFWVVDRGLPCSIRDKVYSHYIDIFFFCWR